MDARTDGIAASTAGRFRWTIVLWLAGGGIINYLDRAVLSIAAPEMITDLGLSRTQIGLLGSIFAWTYAIMQLPSGYLIDRVGAKRVFVFAMGLWSVATMLTGAVSSMTAFILSRILLGVGEAPCWPTFAKLTAAWFPRSERGLATGLWDSSSKFGPAIAPILLVNLMIWLGWRPLFYVAGVIGLVFAAAFALLYRSYQDAPGLSPGERTYIEAGGGGRERNIAVPAAVWGALFRQPTMWSMIGGYFCTIWIWNIFIAFLPLYLVDRFHLTLGQLGIYASIPWLGGACGEILCGYLGKQVVDRGIATPIDTKRISILICALLTAVTVALLPYVDTVGPTIMLMTAALFLISAITGTAWAMASDVAPSGMTASVGAIQNFGGYFGGALSPVLTGLIVDQTGSYKLAFLSGAVIVGCAALFYLLGVRKPITLPGRNATVAAP